MTSNDKAGKSYLTGRQDPVPDVPRESKELHLGLVEEFLDARWIAKGGLSPLKALWKRKDSLATTELLTFGTALELYKKKVSERSYKKAAEIIKSNDHGNSAAMIFEILAASFFESGKQNVEIPKSNNPGFDFSVVTESNSRIRFSVKALVDSKHVKEFREFADKICDELPALFNGHTTLIMVQKNFEAKGKYSVARTKQAVAEAVARGTPGVPYTTSNEWIIRLDELTPNPGERFSQSRASYTSLLMAPYHRNEQLRFHSKIQEACENLIQHCSDVSPICGNGIIIRVPESVSIADAKGWLSKFWEPKHACISSVIIVRSSYTSSDDLSQSWVLYEFAYVDNPTATVRFSQLAPGKLNITVPIGAVSEVETKTTLNLYGNQIDLRGAYWRMAGRHTYEKSTNVSEGAVSFEFKRYPNIKTSCVFTGFPDGGLEISPNHPPTDELLIL